MNKTVADIVFSAIIGDAAGYTLNGMKKNHIKAVLKEINGYTDPAPALKDNMQRWKKPGLYSSISQEMLITAACIDKKSLNLDQYLKYIKDSPDVPGTDYGIFRDPGEAEKNFYFRVKNGDNSLHHYKLPCSRLLPHVIPLLLIKNEKELLITTIRYISLYTTSSITITCSIFLLQLLKDLILNYNEGILNTALCSAEKTKTEIINNQNIIFDSGHNPDYIISDSDYLIDLFKDLNNNTDPADYEKIICTHADKKKTGTIIRGNVNLPETILPMAVILSDHCSVPEKIFYIAAQEGGASSSLTALSAAITTACCGIHIPENLKNNFVNKKKISTIIDIISEDKNRTSIIKEIYETEPGLTAKELEEYRARNKNIPRSKTGKKEKSRNEFESELSKHVVESWTKLDKAKWKKERKKENS